MSLRELGEFGLIARVAERFAEGAPEGGLGIGDDCAVLPASEGRVTLVTTDTLVEQIHFRRETTSAEALGAKAMAVNLSDVAAMGGAPRAAFLALSLPGDVEVAWLDAFFDGMRGACEASGAALLGGDTTRSPGPVVITITLLGEAEATRVAYRSAGRAGDVVFVTGALGGSGGGLRLLLEGVAEGSGPDEEALIEAHLAPRAHLEEGAWLVRQPGMGALMDVSDGVDSDLRHIIRSSGVGAVVWLESLPISGALERVSEARGWSAQRLAAAAGEDFCLLGTARAEAWPALEAGFAARFGRPLARIGALREGAELVYERAGEVVTLGERGFDHFKQSED